MPKRRWSKFCAAAILLVAASSCGEAPPKTDAAKAVETVVREQDPATEPCSGVDRTSTEAERKAAAERIGTLAQLGDGEIAIGQIMRQEGWTVVWATPSGLEQGVFFLKDQPGGPGTLVQIWGGAAGRDDEKEIAQWTRDLPVAPPARLAECFVAEVTRS